MSHIRGTKSGNRPQRARWVLEGQDGRVVKAGALGDAHVKSWDRTWSNPGFEKANRVGLVLKLRPLVTVAGVSQILVFFPF